MGKSRLVRRRRLRPIAIVALLLWIMLILLLVVVLAPPICFTTEYPDVLGGTVSACQVYGERGEFLLSGAAADFFSFLGQDGACYHFVAPRNLSEGIPWITLADGVYAVYGDEVRLKAAETYAQDGYTITRNGQNRHWSLYSENGYLALCMETVTALPEDVYDVVIDAGHGGSDSGAQSAWLTESVQNLQSATYMAQCFSALGLKVKLTRDGDYCVGQMGAAYAEIDPYLPGGRVATVYDSHACYLLSNHLNASPNGASTGYQVYSSVASDNRWAELTGAKWRQAGMSPSNTSPGLVKQGTYKRYSKDEPQTNRDYYYIIRETGGLALDPDTFLERNPERKEELFVGAEALLLEYCFLDHQEDALFWQEHWQELVEAAVNAAVEYWQL